MKSLKIPITYSIITGLYLAVYYGYHYGFSNQIQYFLLGEKLYDPTFLVNDWFTHETRHTHVVFGYFHAFMKHIGSFEYISQFIMLLLWIALVMAMYLLSSREKDRYGVALMMVLWVVLFNSEESSLGMLTSWTSYLQPSNMSIMLIILGMAAYLRRFYLLAGFAIGAGMLLHPSYFLFFSVLLLCHLAHEINKGESTKNLLKMGVPIAICSMANAIIIYFSFLTTPSPSQEYWDLLFHVRSPHHYELSRWSVEQALRWIGWIFLGGFCLFTGKHGSRLLLSWLASLAIVGLGVIILYFDLMPEIIGLTPWRMAAWPFFLSLFGIVSSVMRYADSADVRKWAMAVSIIIATSIIAWNYSAKIGLTWAIVFVLLFAFSRTIRRSVAYPMAIVLLGFLIFHFPTKHGQSIPAPYAELTNWARQRTDKDSLFVAPPLMGAFRLHARRAIIVGWKSFPSSYDDALEWLDRIKTICGESALVTGLSKGYSQMSNDRLEAIKKKYRPDFIILPNNHNVEADHLKLAFRNPWYSVYSL